MPFSRWFSLVALVALSSLALATAPTQDNPDRVIIIGVDGGDGRTVEEMMDRGELPNMQRLREMGTFARLGTTLPAESPTAWGSLNTGRNPGETGVPGFVRRNLTKQGNLPSAGFGHLVTGTDALLPLEDFEERPFLARFSKAQLYAFGFAAAFLVFLVCLKGLLRMGTAPAVVLSGVLGCVGAWAAGSTSDQFAKIYPRTGNPMQARAFWDIAGDAGVKSVVLDSAQSFDMPSPDGVRVLHGLGTPDLRGGVGDWQIYTTEVEYLERPPKFTVSSTAGQIYKIDARAGSVETTYYGPKNFLRKERLNEELAALELIVKDTTVGYNKSQALRKEHGPRISELKGLLGSGRTKGTDIEVVYGMPMPLTIKPSADGKYTVSFGEQSQELEVGGWSDYYKLSFEMSPMMKMNGVTRCKLISVEPELKLFINTLDIDPESQPFWQTATTPASFGGQLASTGSFETYGWACMTMPFKDGQISPELMLEDIEFTFKWRERLFFDQVMNGDFSLFMGIFSTPDRVQHMTYQYYDEKNPMHDPEVANREIVFFGETIKLKEAVPAIFRQLDRVVGRVLDEVLQPGDELLMCADHGFQSIHQQVHINNLLAELGYLTLKADVTVADGGSINDYVDWSKTEAYGLGIGTVFLNLQGREGKGIVDPAEAEAKVKEITAALKSYRDPVTGVQVVDEVYATSEIHSGDFLDDEAEMIMGFTPTYRISWATTGGAIKLQEVDGKVVLRDVLQDNTSPWSGGHPSVTADAVRGLFFSSRPINLPEGGPNLLHIAPTVLSMLGVPIPAEMDLPPMILK